VKPKFNRAFWKVLQGFFVKQDVAMVPQNFVVEQEDAAGFPRDFRREI